MHLSTAWAADGGIEDAGADASATATPDAGADGGDQADGGEDDYTSCGAKRADRGNGMFLFGTGCC